MLNYFYNKVIWTHIAAFADVFNEMSVLVYDKDGKAIGYKPVPVILSAKEKVVSMILHQNNTKEVRAIEHYLPLLSISWKGISRNTERQRGQREKRKILIDYEDPNEPQVIYDLQTVPYDLSLELTIWTKYMDDMAQILENILPFFNPEAPISLYERGIGIERQVKVALESVNLNFVTDLQDTDRRVLQSNLSYKMECNFYKPQGPITKPVRRITVLLGGENNNGNSISYDGTNLNIFTVPNSENPESFLDMDKKIWTYKKQFDDNEINFFNEAYNIGSNIFGLRNPNKTNPYEDKTTRLHDIPEDEIHKGIKNNFNNSL